MTTFIFIMLGISFYLIIGIIIGAAVNYIDKREHDFDNSAIFAISFLWPLVIVMAVLYLLASFCSFLIDWIDNRFRKS